MTEQNDRPQSTNRDDGEDEAKDNGTGQATSQTPATPSLNDLHKRLAVVRDRVRGVALGRQAGLYLFGRPGTAKTHTVIETLEEVGRPFSYQNGHLTPLGLFDLLVEQPHGLCVLDDVAELLSNRVALQLLLAALGSQLNGDRIVKYRRKDVDLEVRFTGQLVLISNLELHPSPLLQALKSRVHYIEYAPSDEEIAALMRHIASQGWPSERPRLSADQSTEVAEFVIAESIRLGHRLDLRMLVDRAFPDMVQYLDGETESHWRDLVSATLEEQLVAPKYPLRQPIGRQELKEAEQGFVQQLITTHPTREEQLAAWCERTRKSPRAFYRRLAELQVTRDVLTL
jgi:hypothetical protein